MKFRYLPIICITFVFVFITSTKAQDTFSPDRPGLGNGTYVLNPKITYLETGVEYYDRGFFDEMSIGQVLFRHGLIEGAELRVKLNSFIIQTSPFDDQTGVPDPGVGLKVNLLDKPASSFRLSGHGSITIPTGSSQFSYGEWVPSFSLLAERGLTQRWTLAGNLGYSFGPGQQQEIVSFTMTPSYVFNDNKSSTFFGYAGFYGETYEQHFIEAGFTNRVTPNLQLDLNGGFEAETGNVFVGAGLAIRF